MGVYIKGMEIPISCFYCPFREKANPDDYVCMALNKEFEETFSLIVGKRHKDCPLVPVPPHGRLGDLDVLFEFVESKYKVAKGEARKAYSDVLDFICAAGDIIEAEEGE